MKRSIATEVTDKCGDSAYGPARFNHAGTAQNGVRRLDMPLSQDSRPSLAALVPPSSRRQQPHAVLKVGAAQLCSRPAAGHIVRNSSLGTRVWCRVRSVADRLNCVAPFLRHGDPNDVVGHDWVAWAS